MKNATITAIDRSGRLVIPKDIRDRAGLEPGTPLEIVFRDGVIEIVARPRDVLMVRDGDLVVAVPTDPSEPLRAETVRDLIDEQRGERGRG